MGGGDVEDVFTVTTEAVLCVEIEGGVLEVEGPGGEIDDSEGAGGDEVSASGFSLNSTGLVRGVAWTEVISLARLQ